MESFDDSTIICHTKKWRKEKTVNEIPSLCQESRQFQSSVSKPECDDASPIPKTVRRGVENQNDRFKRTTSASARHPKDCLPTDEAILFPAVDEEKIGTGAIEEILDFSASPRRDRIHIGGVSGAVPQQGDPHG